MATEILYCARCHRVIIPREIEKGEYHFVDGDAVCRECFTRLSRRLRPVSGARQESDSKPIPVNLGELEKELAKGTDGTRAPRMISRDRHSTSYRLAPVASYRQAQTIFMVCCLVMGIVLGAILYTIHPVDSGATEGPTSNYGQPAPPDDPANPGGASRPEDNDPGPEPAPQPARLGTDGTYRITPSADASVAGGEHAGRPLGGKGNLVLGCSEGRVTHEALLRFDLAGVTEQVHGAKLRLVLAGVTGPPGIRQGLGLVTDRNWRERTVSWDSSPPAAEALRTWQLTPESKDVEIDVTGLVKAALAAGERLSLRLGPTDRPAVQSRIEYHSREGSIEYRPQLVIDTRPPQTASETPTEKPEPTAAPVGKPVEIAPGILSVPPEADAFVRAGQYAAKPHGTDETLVVKRAEEDFTRETYLRFDLSAVPADVKSAKLVLHPSSVGETKGMLLQATALESRDWNELKITWKDRPATGAKVASWQPEKNRPSEVDLTDAVKAARAAGKISLRIASVGADTDETWIIYGSREGAEKLRPALIVDTGKSAEKPPDTAEKPPDTTEKPPDTAEKPGSPIATGPGRLVRVFASGDVAVSSRTTVASPFLVRSTSLSVRKAKSYESEAYIKFRLPEKVGGEVSMALLRLYNYGSTRAKLRNELVLLENDSWEADKLVWKGRPTKGKVLASWDVQQRGSVLLDVTKEVKAALAGDRRIALRVRPLVTDNRYSSSLSSTENTNAGIRPQLLLFTGGLQPGLKARYYRLKTVPASIPALGAMFPTAEGVVKSLDFNNSSSAWKGVDPKAGRCFGSRFNGLLKVEKAGSYKLYLESDDGSRLYLNGVSLVSNDGVHAMKENASANVHLASGYHELRVDHFSQGGGSGLILRWEGPGIEKQVVPAEMLFRVDRPEDNMVSLVPAADTYVIKDQVRTNSFDPAQRNGTNRSLQVSVRNDTHAFMWFDLSGVKVPIRRARLRIKNSSGFFTTQAGQQVIHSVHLVPKAGWRETAMYYQNRQPVGRLIDTYELTQRKAWAFDVTADVRKALEKARKIAFAIRPAPGCSETRSCSYYSRESGPANGPRLVLEFGKEGEAGSSGTQVVSAKAEQLLPAIADTYVCGSRAGEALGKLKHLAVSKRAKGGQFALLRFDLSKLPGTIKSAKLRLHVLQSVEGKEIRNSACLVRDRNWTEENAIWRERPAPGTLLIFATPQAGKPVEFDVTGAAAAAKKRGELSLAICPVRRDGVIKYVSREGDAAQRPVLVVVTGPKED
ncbi:MAG: CBM96 family carbohydrate-binding protein [Planctomycetota bacterium]